MITHGRVRSEDTPKADVDTGLLAHLRAAALDGAGLGALTACLMALADSGALVSKGARGLLTSLPHFTILLGFSASITWGVCGVWLALVSHFETQSRDLLSRRQTVREWLVAAVMGLPLVAFGLWVPFGWIAEHWPAQSYSARIADLIAELSVAGTAIASVVAVRRFVVAYRSLALPRYHWPLLGAMLAVALACYWADARVLVGLYDDFHQGLGVAFALALSAFSVLGLCSRPNWRGLVGRYAQRAAGAFIVLGAVEFSIDARAWQQAAALEGALTTQRAVGLWSSIADLDGDGFSGLFGLNDCAVLDARRSPGALDVPGNGVDEDCSGADARWPDPVPLAAAVGQTTGLNVLFISIDTLRADRLSAYGNRHNTSPNIDSVAKRGLLFTNAFSQASKTFESIPSFMSGLYPTNIPRDFIHLKKGRSKPYIYTIPRQARLLPELFKKKGYKTQAVVAIDMLRQLSLDRGFDDFVVKRDVMPDVKRLLGDVQSPFFMWVHLVDPHSPYIKHKRFDFGDKDIDRYDSEAAYDDAFVGEILQLLEQRKLSDHTIVVITADHGEEFREHGGQFHPPKLYHELLHVPLVISVPGEPAAKLDDVVELVDIVPSLCLKLGLGDCEDFDGDSLWPDAARASKPRAQADLGAAEVDTSEGAFSEVRYAPRLGILISRSITTPRWRYTEYRTSAHRELFDLVNDPGEHENVIALQPELARTLHEASSLRPYRRVAEAFRLAEKGDTSELTKQLWRIREEGMLLRAIELIRKSPAGRAKSALETVGARPGCPASIRAAVNAALGKLGDSPARRGRSPARASN
jgi:arylsulfatase A-like enzyme